MSLIGGTCRCVGHVVVALLRFRALGSGVVCGRPAIEGTVPSEWRPTTVIMTTGGGPSAVVIRFSFAASCSTA
jgi:hypothetical protein